MDGGGGAESAALRGAHGEGTARSARLHPAVESGRLRNGDAIRQCADQGRDHDSSRDGARSRSPASSTRRVRTSSRSAQAFRPHVMDMFEPQDHPDDIAYPGATPTAPYDVAGYTLAYQMGVQFDRILDGFDGPFEKLDGLREAAGRRDSRRPGAARLLLQPQVERQLHRRQSSASRPARDVSWLWNGPMGYGTFYVAAKPTTRAILQQGGGDLGVSFEAGDERAGRTGRRSCGSCASASTISTAARCRPGGRA